ncbi:MAG: hypothetical protein KF764_03000 [Labilithrix sp.]|nr:hypothetical protein [Labilithrix sp.]
MASQQFSAINTFVQRVRAYLTAHGVTAAVGFGWAEKERQNNRGPSGDRVVFEPADGNSGGRIGPIRGGPGWFLQTMEDGSEKWVRALYSWERTFAVYVWAAPPPEASATPATQAEALALVQDVPALQEDATAALMEKVIRAMRAAGSVWIQVGRVDWVKAENKQIGREQKIQLTLTGNILDEALTPAIPDTENSGVNRP